MVAYTHHDFTTNVIRLLTDWQCGDLII